MAIKVDITNITNISKQTITFLYSKISEKIASASSQVPFNKEGIFQLMPNSAVEIESSRVDLGQLQKQQDLGLIRLAARPSAGSGDTSQLGSGLPAPVYELDSNELMSIITAASLPLFTLPPSPASGETAFIWADKIKSDQLGLISGSATFKQVPMHQAIFNGPTFIANALGRNNTIRFDGVNDNLRQESDNGGTQANIIAPDEAKPRAAVSKGGSSDFTVNIAIANIPAKTSTEGLFTSLEPRGDLGGSMIDILWNLIWNSSNELVFEISPDGDVGSLTSSSGLVLTDPAIITVTYSKSDELASIYMNGGLEEQFTAPMKDLVNTNWGSTFGEAATSTNIGVAPEGAFDALNLRYYNQVLTQSTITKVIAPLATRYGVTLAS